VAVVQDGYTGVTIDYGALQVADRDGFTAFITELTAALHGYNKLVIIRPSTPVEVPGGYDMGGYDWRALGAVADGMIVDPGYGSGVMESYTHASSVIGWAVGEVNRIKLYYESSTNSIKQTDAGLAPLSYDDALNGLGTVIASTPPADNGGLYPTGSQISFDLNGGVTDFSTDSQFGISSYSPAGSTGQEKVWIISAATIRARLDALNAFHLGGILVADLLASGNDTGTFTALNEYKDNLPSTIPAQLALQWDISGGTGAISNQTTGIGTPMVWQADTDGSYIVRGAVVGGRNSDRGSVNLQVGAPATTPPPVVHSSGGNSAPPPAAATTAPPPVTGNVMAGSGFELGGQTQGTGAFGVMQSAKMSWVKFQHKWSPGDTAGGEASRVAAAKAAGFKVLMSVPGTLYPTSIDYGSYINFLKDLAGIGVDGIEVWNEMNLAREWPQGDISGTSYVNNMLAPAYQAIKSVNPGVIVISGAPAPSGYWGGCGSGGTPDTTGCDDWAYLIQMRDAGAANYMDCMGVHFNSGATGPSDTTGHPADAGDHHYTWYYSKMYATYYGTIGKPLCFTELGYLSAEGYGSLPSNFWWAANTSVAEQAQWLADTAVLASQSKQVRLIIVFNVDFTVWEAFDPQAGYAMIRPGGGCPACAALAGVMP
jgi:hypothetical protein